MPYAVTLPPGVRGDAFERAIALTYPGPLVSGRPGPNIPMPADKLAQLQAAYPTMQAEFRKTATDATALISLSSGDSSIRIEAAYPLPDGTTGPCLVLRFTGEQTKNVISECVWDLQFSGPGVGPYTWIGGKWKIVQDVTRPDAGLIVGPIET